MSQKPENRFKQWRQFDPEYAQEQDRYGSAIPSRQFLLEFLEQCAGPQEYKAVVRAFAIKGEDAREAVRRRLKAMERDGQIIWTRRGYGPISKMDLVRGRVQGHSDGHGFLIPEEGGARIFLPPRQMRPVLDGDRVVARVTQVDRRGRSEGAVVEVVERTNLEVVGRYQKEGEFGYVVPLNTRISQDILIPDQGRGEAHPGMVVVARITEQPSRRSQPIGVVQEILGETMHPGMETEVAIRNYGIPQEWPEAVEAQIATLTEEVPEAAKQGREDLRELPLVTIDGADARDFDDAVYCEANAKGWRLLVAIADVSAYVEPDSALDQEAQARGNSVYFPQRVVPMLPEVLSNGLCSINPQVDRLCMVCELQLNAAGEVTGSRFFDGVMRSAARLTYEQVADALAGETEDVAQMAQLLPHLRELHRLYLALRQAREARGAIDFETKETRFLFAEDGAIDGVEPVVRNDAHKMIEECMIAANVAAATLLEQKRMPTLYRVHDRPDPARLSDLREFLFELGLNLGGGEQPEAGDYARLLKAVEGREDAELIQTVLLRSLNQACYQPDNLGHFGLAHERYAHFTSPIRRYPDLLVHRALRHLTQGGTAENFAYDHAAMQMLGESCSATERRADEATRDAIEWLKCEYMRDHLGAEFDGVITGVTGFGLFVTLQGLSIEGLIHVTALEGDYYHFDAAKHRLSGERSGRMYRLMDRVHVRVVRVDVEERKIDLELMGQESATDQPQKPKSKRRRKPRK